MTETKDKSSHEDEKSEGKKTSVFRRFGRNFITGILVFLPLAILIFIIRILAQTITAVGKALFGITESLEATLVIVTAIALLITYAGSKFSRREKWTLNALEKAITAIPYVGSWYETIKDLVGSLTGTSNKADSYLGVVQVSIGPAKMLGFVTRKVPGPGGSVRLTVFVPTSPNPTSGLVFFLDEKDITYVDMNPEQAFKIIISLGLKT